MPRAQLILQIVHDLLTQRHLTLATAESCTGGAIAARFTAMPGASAYFRCGVVSYTVEAKHDLLGVSLDDIDRYGVVSEPVVRAMAEGMRRTAHADYAVATTGVAGPAGGTPRALGLVLGMGGDLRPSGLLIGKMHKDSI